MNYAEIILPVAGGPYTYSVPEELKERLVPGCAVAVQFGVRKIVGGIVRRLSDRRPEFTKIKPVNRLLFSEPVVSESQLRLWEWVAEYYMASPGEVMRVALPALLKPSGFSEEEFAADEFHERRVKMVGLSPELAGEAAFNEACEALKRAPKQYEALVEIGTAIFSTTSPSPSGNGTPIYHGGEFSHARVARAELKTETAILNALAKKNLIVIEEHTRIAHAANPSLFTLHSSLPKLSPTQQTSLDRLRTSLKTHTTALLFGVPSSGKSEVCFHAIAGSLARGCDVLLLLPEIALTTQFVGRVRRVFGDRVVLYHSGLSDRRRAEAYIRLSRSQGGSLIVGTRSALFLPMPRLGLVVVDEEQDPSYKQQDPAPRYNARDGAIMLANLSQVNKDNPQAGLPGVGEADSGGNPKVILVSATPSLETWANVQAGKYGLVELTERWGGTLPPEIVVSDTLRAVKRGERRGHLNKELRDAIAGALSRGEQVILFQNRRGLAPFVECTDCGHVPKCDHCGIPMTVHRGTLRCHYCGAVVAMPSLCPGCGGMNLTTRGFGTEKIEEELARLFPDARVARLDRDSATSERAYRRIIDDLEGGATDILVGTQMVTKGFDFERVSLVGVLNADNLANHPDFRASERAWSLMAQVAGRAGRHGGGSPLACVRGKVVIQTAAPDNPLIGWAATGDYRAMAAELLAERSMYGYPPYTRLFSVMLRHREREVLDAAAVRLATLLRPVFGDRLLGPQPPVVEKIKGQWALVFLLKIPRSEPLGAVRTALRAALDALSKEPEFRGVSATINVDPG
ncbi:MAG: primosomal protein N' [Alistipes sp.]|jgi:primosomal protein N' (replication factor Y)|nr:primosomal protein N' [Alistipes sp.]